MEVGTIVQWHVKEGDKFDGGDIFCDVETDKATIGFESLEEGYVAKVLVGEGVADLPVGTPIMVTVDNESDISSFKDFVAEKPSSGVAASASSDPPPTTTSHPSPPTLQSAASSNTPSLSPVKTESGKR